MFKSLRQEVGAISLETMKERHLMPESAFIQVQGMDVHYRDVNEAPAGAPVLLMLHGIFSSLHTWNAWTECLKPYFRLISLDNPNFGLTGAHPEGMRTYLYSDFINAFTDALGLSQFHLAGSSLGGWMSWEFAARFPHKVEKLILLDSAGFFFVPPALLISMGLPLGGYIAKRSQLPRKMVYAQTKTTYFDASKLSQETLARYYDLLMREGNRSSAARVVRYIRNHIGFPHKLLKQVQCPTLIMWGEHDRWIPPAHAQQFKQHIKNAQVKMYANCGHLPMEELAEQSAADALVFLSTP